MTYSDLDLIRMRIDALFVHDANGQLLRINEPDPTHPAPRFFLSRTREGNLWRTRHDVPAELARELERLAGDEPVVRDLASAPEHAADYAALLRQYAPITAVETGLAYALPELDPPHSAVMVTPENASLLQAHFLWAMTALDEYAPVAVAAVDGSAVAICFSARITAHVAEAGVYTEAIYRGRGYAADTVRAWTAGIRAMGRLPLYSTSSTNSASQQVAGKLGARQYGVDYSIP